MYKKHACQTWNWDWLRLLYTVTVVQGSISWVMGQHLSTEHLLLAAQGNCTFTSSCSSFKETVTEGGLYSGGERRGRDCWITQSLTLITGRHIKADCCAATDWSHCSRTCAARSRRWSWGRGARRDGSCCTAQSLRRRERCRSCGRRPRRTRLHPARGPWKRVYTNTSSLYINIFIRWEKDKKKGKFSKCFEQAQIFNSRFSFCRLNQVTQQKRRNFRLYIQQNTYNSKYIYW